MKLVGEVVREEGLETGIVSVVGESDPVASEGIERGGRGGEGGSGHGGCGMIWDEGGWWWTGEKVVLMRTRYLEERVRPVVRWIR